MHGKQPHLRYRLRRTPTGVLVALLTLLVLPIGPLTKAAADEPAEATGEAAAEPRPLSVAPLSETAYPDDRPDWVDAAPTFGEEVDLWPVKSLLRPTADEARESLQVQIQGAAAAYAEQFLGEDRARRLGDSVRLAPDVATADLESIAPEDRYSGTATLGDQTVYEEAVRLRFDEEYRQQLAAQWQQSEVGRRLILLAIAAGGSVCLLVSSGSLVRRLAYRRAATPH